MTPLKKIMTIFLVMLCWIILYFKICELSSVSSCFREEQSTWIWSVLIIILCGIFIRTRNIKILNGETKVPALWTRIFTEKGIWGFISMNRTFTTNLVLGVDEIKFRGIWGIFGGWEKRNFNKIEIVEMSEKEGKYGFFIKFIGDNTLLGVGLNKKEYLKTVLTKMKQKNVQLGEKANKIVVEL